MQGPSREVDADGSLPMTKATLVPPPRPPGLVADHPETWQGGTKARAGWVVEDDPTFHLAVARLDRPRKRRHLEVAA